MGFTKITHPFLLLSPFFALQEGVSSSEVSLQQELLVEVWDVHLHRTRRMIWISGLSQPARLIGFQRWERHRCETSLTWLQIEDGVTATESRYPHIVTQHNQ